MAGWDGKQDAEMAKKIAKLARTHRVRISSANERGIYGFAVVGAGYDAKSMPNKTNVARAEKLDSRNQLLESASMSPWQWQYGGMAGLSGAKATRRSYSGP